MKNRPGSPPIEPSPVPRIGIYASQATEHDNVAQARLIEELGLDTVWLGEALGPPNRLDTAALCAALLQATSTLKVGVAAFNVATWYPQSLARAAASLEWLFPGRFILGVGAGYHRFSEAQGAWGYPVREDRDRIAFFREAVEYLDRYFREETVSFQGDHVRVPGATGSPWIGGRRPPFLIGGSRPSLMRIAARYADLWDGMGLWNYSAREDEDFESFFVRKRDEFAQMCREAGRDPGQVTVCHTMFAALAPNRPAADALAAEAERALLMGGRPGFVGTAEDLVEFLLRSWRLGARDFQIVPAATRMPGAKASPLDFIRAVGTEVAPAVRAAARAAAQAGQAG